MKLTKRLAIWKPVALVAAGLMIGGAVAAGAADTAPSVLLCVDTRGNITAPTSGACTQKQTALRVASEEQVSELRARMTVTEAADVTRSSQIGTLASDATALAARVSTLEATVQAQTTAINIALVPTITWTTTAAYGNNTIQYVGSHLKPGTPINIHYTNPDGASYSYPNFSYSVTGDGDVAARYVFSCDQTSIYLTGTSAEFGALANGVSSTIMYRTC